MPDSLSKDELRHIYDYRYYAVYTNLTKNWRNYLKVALYQERGGLSDLSGKPVSTALEMHEGLFPRSVVPRGINWHPLLFSGVNCFLLAPGEHRPYPPSRAVCYWLAVARYGRDLVDRWIDSLPFKVAPPQPWRGTKALEILRGIPIRGDFSEDLL